MSERCRNVHLADIGPPKQTSPRLHINATINVECLTGDILSVYNQVADCTRYLLGGPNATQRDTLENGLLCPVKYGRAALTVKK